MDKLTLNVLEIFVGLVLFALSVDCMINYDNYCGQANGTCQVAIRKVHEWGQFLTSHDFVDGL